MDADYIDKYINELNNWRLIAKRYAFALGCEKFYYIADQGSHPRIDEIAMRSWDTALKYMNSGQFYKDEYKYDRRKKKLNPQIINVPAFINSSKRCFSTCGEDILVDDFSDLG
ncbi:MAG: hypothetical protein IKU63_02905 [Bacteroidaceae bacterium]|nr:hypothetical protein [Bacteroidaceae bacterium]